MNGPDMELEVPLSDEQDLGAQEQPVPCRNISGPAGSGKTYGIKLDVARDYSYGVLSATTGIASVNLGAITIHSLLKYSDTLSLRDSFLCGNLVRALHKLARAHRWIIVDEKSMIDAEQLDLWYRAIAEVNQYKDVRQGRGPLGLMLVGDFGQLAPVRARWAFEAGCWRHFAANTTQLTKIWRQDAGAFLDALNLARAGQGRHSADLLLSAGAQFHSAVDTRFDGTTILPKNDMVRRYNELALDRLPGDRITTANRRWGMQRKEWGLNKRTKEWGIPESADFKIGAYVMMLNNSPDFSVVNGDCGHILSYDGERDRFTVHILRTDRDIEVARHCRAVEVKDEPEGFDGPRLYGKEEDDGSWLPKVHYRGTKGRYVLGQVERFPFQLAYASTVHKSQGLTLDRVQLDYRDRFFASPAMLYVALSRCRTLEGLRLVGMPEIFARHCAVDPRTLPWL